MKVKKVVLDEGDLAILTNMYNIALKAFGMEAFEGVTILKTKIDKVEFEDIQDLADKPE